MVGPVGFEPTTSAESVVYGYPHALPNILIPPKRWASAYPTLYPGARRHPLLGPVRVWLDYGPIGPFERLPELSHRARFYKIVAIRFGRFRSSRYSSTICVWTVGLFSRSILESSKMLSVFFGFTTMKKRSTSACLLRKNLNFVSSLVIDVG